MPRVDIGEGFRTTLAWFNPITAWLKRVQEILARLDWWTPWHNSKLISIFLLVAAGTTIGWLHQKDEYFVYREDVTFTNLAYLDPQELYQASLVDGLSTFWLRPREVRQAILRHPYVADAEIDVQLPAQVTIKITEREPVALWVTDAGSLWLLEDGTALTARDNRYAGILQIVDGLGAARAISFAQKPAMNKEILDNAQKLASYFPSLTMIMFHEGVGLNFPSPSSGIWVYWGDGSYFETKLKNLLTIENELTQGRISAELVDLRLPEKPIIR